MVKRILLVLGAALLLRCPAWAFSNTLYAAKADVLFGCSAIYEPLLGMKVLRCPQGGGTSILHMTMPTEATSGTIGLTLRSTTPVVTPVGNACTRVCTFVGIGGSSLLAATDPVNWSCSAQMPTFYTGQWELALNTVTGLVPNYTNDPGMCCGDADHNGTVTLAEVQQCQSLIGTAIGEPGFVPAFNCNGLGLIDVGSCQRANLNRINGCPSAVPSSCNSPSATSCSNGELYLFLIRDAGCSADDNDYTSLTVNFQ